MTRRRSPRRWNKLLQKNKENKRNKLLRVLQNFKTLKRIVWISTKYSFLHILFSKFYLIWSNTDLWLLALWQGGFWDKRLLLWGENIFSSSWSFLSWRFNSRDTFVLILDNRAMLELKYVTSITNSACGRKTCLVKIMLAWSIVGLSGNIVHWSGDFVHS